MTTGNPIILNLDRISNPVTSPAAVITLLPPEYTYLSNNQDDRVNRNNARVSDRIVYPKKIVARFTMPATPAAKATLSLPDSRRMIL